MKLYAALLALALLLGIVGECLLYRDRTGVDTPYGRLTNEDVAKGAVEVSAALQSAEREGVDADAKIAGLKTRLGKMVAEAAEDGAKLRRETKIVEHLRAFLGTMTFDYLRDPAKARNAVPVCDGALKALDDYRAGVRRIGAKWWDAFALDKVNGADAKASLENSYRYCQAGKEYVTAWKKVLEYCVEHPAMEAQGSDELLWTKQESPAALRLLREAGGKETAFKAAAQRLEDLAAKIKEKAKTAVPGADEP